MSAASDTSWFPLTGQHPVTIGPTLSKALKSKAADQSKSKFERNYFAFRYNFKPPSIDTTKPAAVHINKGQESTSVRVEFPDTQSQANGSNEPPGVHTFSGVEVPAKEWECVLIWDPNTGVLQLEKVDSFINLTKEGRGAASVASAPPVASSSSSRKAEKRSADDLEQALIDSIEGGEPEPQRPVRPAPAPIPKARPKKEQKDVQTPTNRHIASKEPAGARREAPPPQLPQKPKEVARKDTQPPKRKPVAKSAIASASIPVSPAPSIPSSAPPPAPSIPKPTPPAPVSKLPAKPKGPPPPPATVAPKRPPKREPEASLADVEELEFGKPPRPAKKPRMSETTSNIINTGTEIKPPEKVSAGLALPGGGTNFAPPPAPITAPRNSLAVGMLQEVDMQHAEPGSESEEDEWDEVPVLGTGTAKGGAAVPPAPADNFQDDVMVLEEEEEEEEEGGQEIDAAAFAMELEMEEYGNENENENDNDNDNGEAGGEEEWDFLREAIAEPEPAMQPKSLMQYAAENGGLDAMSDDDDSSDDDSDDD